MQAFVVHDGDLMGFFSIFFDFVFSINIASKLGISNFWTSFRVSLQDRNFQKSGFNSPSLLTLIKCVGHGISGSNPLPSLLTTKVLISNFGRFFGEKKETIDIYFLNSRFKLNPGQKKPNLWICTYWAKGDCSENCQGQAETREQLFARCEFRHRQSVK